MIWLYLAVGIIFLYFSAGFAYFPVFDQCVNRTRLQWLVKALFYFYSPPLGLMIIFSGIAETVLNNIERNPGPIWCWRLQKCLFWIIFGPLLIWMTSASFVGLGMLKILGISDQSEDAPDSEKAE